MPFFYSTVRSSVLLLLALVVSFTLLGSSVAAPLPLGTSGDPFTAVNQARSVTVGGVYYFSLGGTTFSTYVDQNGYLLVAIDFGNGRGSLPQVTALQTDRRGILSPNRLSKLIGAVEIRMSSSNGQLNAISTNTTLLQRVRTNINLMGGSQDNSHNVNQWSGTGSYRLNAGAPTFQPTYNLNDQVYHAYGDASQVYWVPYLDGQGLVFNSDIGNTEDIRLWVRGDNRAACRVNTKLYLPTAIVEKCGESVIPPTANDECGNRITATTSDVTSFSAPGNYNINWIFTSPNARTTVINQAVRVSDNNSPLPTNAVGAGEFNQRAKLIADDRETGDFLGQSVSVDGDRMVAGAISEKTRGEDAGAAYVYERGTDGNWVQSVKLLGQDTEAGDNFGNSVDLSGDRLVVGAYFEATKGREAGAAYIFDRGSNGAWTQVAKLIGLDTKKGDFFGRSVSLSGDRLVVGADYEDSRGSNAGAVYIFERGSGGAWTQVAKLLAQGGRTEDFFGRSVSVFGDHLAVGAAGEDTRGSEAGVTYVFERGSTGTWNQVAKLQGTDTKAGDRLGFTVAMSQNRFVAGANREDTGGSNSGAAYVFERGSNGSWTQQAKLKAVDAQEGDNFGKNLSLSGDRIAVGANFNDEGASNAGAAYVFERGSGGAWTQVRKVQALDPGEGNFFGEGIDLSGDHLVVGAAFEGNFAGAVYSFELSYVLPEVVLTTCSADAITRPLATDACSGSVTATTADPTTFNSLGDYSIEWTFNDGNGNRSTATQAVRVTDVSVALPIVETFESGSRSRDCWLTYDANNDGGWARTDNAAYAKTGSSAFLLAANNASAQNDRLESPVFPAAADTDYELSFNYRALGNANTGQLRAVLIDATTNLAVGQLSNDKQVPNRYEKVTLRFAVPMTGSYRIAFESTAAAGSEGLLLDDIGIKVFTAPTNAALYLVYNTKTECQTVRGFGLDGEAWTRFITPAGRLIAEINANGNDLGDVDLSVDHSNTIPDAPFLGNQPIMGRYFNITPVGGGGTYDINGGVRVRLYFSETELAVYNDALDQDNAWGELLITHYEAVNTDCQLANSTDLAYTTETLDRDGVFGTTAHYLEFTTTTFSEFGVISQSAAPVVLTEFTARTDGNHNLLEWEVESEIDFSHYLVERSTDGSNFTMLDELAGTGAGNYTTTDLQPADQTYYRLKMVDLDGSYAYSKIVSVSRRSAVGSLLEVFPVPTHGPLTVRFTTLREASVELQVTDALGRRVHLETVRSTAGTNEHPLDVSRLPSGTYQLTLKQRDVSQTVRMVIE